MTSQPEKSQVVLPAIGAILLLGLGLILWANHNRLTTVAWLPAWQPQPAFRLHQTAAGLAQTVLRGAE